VFCVMLSYVNYSEDFPVLGSYSTFICCCCFFLLECLLCPSVAIYMQEYYAVCYVVCTCVSGLVS
jgi:hypothetical protein